MHQKVKSFNENKVQQYWKEFWERKKIEIFKSVEIKKIWIFMEIQIKKEKFQYKNVQGYL